MSRKGISLEDWMKARSRLSQNELSYSYPLLKNELIYQANLSTRRSAFAKASADEATGPCGP